VYSTVDFDGESLLMAVEVDHEAADGMLPSELKSTQTAIAEGRPEKALRASGLPPELPGGFPDDLA